MSPRTRSSASWDSRLEDEEGLSVHLSLSHDGGFALAFLVLES